MLKSYNIFSLAFITALLVLTGCGQQRDAEMETQTGLSGTADSATMSTAATNFTKAIAVVHPTEGNDVTGTVTFEKVSNGVKVHAELSGLAEGKHGFHIHQYGDCTADDGTSAGGHYNPFDEKHGAPTDSVRHMGDMGNITADADGNATIDYVDKVIELNGPNGIMGRGIVLHAGEDDLTSQPSGAAGDRMACGVIGVDDAGSNAPKN